MAQGQGTKADYERAYALRGVIGGKVFRDRFTALWLGDHHCTYTNRLRAGKRELVIELAKFMTNTKHEREAAYAMTTLPTRHSASDVWEDDPFQQYVLRVTKYGTRDGIQGYGIPLVNMTRASLQAAMSRQLTPREALANFVRRGNRFIVRDIERRERAL